MFVATGPLELALMKYRLNTGHAVTLTAKESLLTGRGVRPKIRQNPDGSSFAPPVDCPAEGYYGPLPMSGVQIKWSGISLPGVTTAAASRPTGLLHAKDDSSSLTANMCGTDGHGTCYKGFCMEALNQCMVLPVQ